MNNEYIALFTLNSNQCIYILDINENNEKITIKLSNEDKKHVLGIYSTLKGIYFTLYNKRYYINDFIRSDY